MGKTDLGCHIAATKSDLTLNALFANLQENQFGEQTIETSGREGESN